MLTHIENIQQLGQYLREVREGQKLSLEQASEQLNIRTIYLRALEDGEWNALPGLAYGRGYLRQYAGLLGLSVDEMMEVCARLQGKISSRLHYLDIAGTEEAPSHSMLWLSLALVGAALWGWFYWQDDGAETNITDSSISDSLTEWLSTAPPVTPSPYPLPAQECMKMLQRLQNPCYWVTEQPQPYQLAYWPPPARYDTTPYLRYYHR